MVRRRRATSKRKNSKGKPVGELPVLDVTWQGGVATVGEIVPGAPEHAREWRIVLWVEEETELVVAARLFEAEEPLAAFVNVLLEAQRQPAAGPPRRPARVAVRDRRLAALLEERVGGLDMEVQLVRRLELWDRAARDLGESLSRGSEASYLAGEGVEPADVAAFFEAAADYYRAAPWRLLGDDEPVELAWSGREGPVWAVVLGGAETTYGLALYLSGRELAAIYAKSEVEALARAEAIAVTFEGEGTLPPRMREERRRHRWPVAGPAAYPVPLHSSGSDVVPVTRDDLALLALALRAVAELVRRHRADLRRAVSVRVALRVPAAGGGRLSVSVRVPAELPGAEVALPGGAELEETPPGEGGRTLLFDEMRDRILRLPGARRVLDRLAWSFFRAAAPNYVGRNPAAREQALARFLDWAMFAARTWPDGRTLAERALDAASELSGEALEVRRRFCRPRYSIYQVTGVRRGEGLELKDEFTGERFQVRERLGTYQVRKGWTVMGALFPISGDEYVLPSSPVVYGVHAPLPKDARLPEGPEELAPAMEEALFHADTTWIDELWTARELAEAYEEFRRAVSGAGEKLPSFGELQRLVRGAAMPSDAMEAAAAKVQWWTLQEANVFVKFLIRTWNLTPRRELHGRSPLQGIAEEGAGPQQRRLARLMMEELAPRILERAPKSKQQRRRLTQELGHQWLHTPRDDLGGRTPAEVIEDEERRRGRENRDG